MTEPTRKKVLYFITKSNWGGAQRYVFDLATSLPTHYEPVVVLGGTGILKDKLEQAGVRVHPLASLERDISLIKELRALWELSRIIRREQPDVLHVNSSKAGGLGSFIGRLLRVPRIIFTAHGWAFNEDRPGWQKVLIKFFHWLTVLLAHDTIAVSSGMKAQLTWPWAQRKMTVINPGRAPIAFFARPDARERLSSHAPVLAPFEHDHWLGTIAELHPIKRLVDAIESVKTLAATHPTLRYIIIGEGDARTELQTFIDEQGLSDRVFLIGAITEAGRYLKAFDAFILPSQSEAVGYVLVEAAQAGLPIVATKVGGITDIISHETNGLLVPPKTIPSLTTALSRIITDQTFANQLGRTAERQATHFSLEQMVEHTITLYESNNSSA